MWILIALVCLLFVSNGPVPQTPVMWSKICSLQALVMLPENFTFFCGFCYFTHLLIVDKFLITVCVALLCHREDCETTYTYRMAWLSRCSCLDSTVKQPSASKGYSSFDTAEIQFISWSLAEVMMSFSSVSWCWYKCWKSFFSLR